MKLASPELILASGSRARAELLHDAGINFLVEAAKIDEASLRAELTGKGLGTGELALALASEKALAVSSGHPEAIVIGADQMLVAGDTRYDKAADLDELRRHLLELRGRQHQLLSAMAIATAGEIIFSHLGVATLQLRDFSAAFLDQYLETVGVGALAMVGGYAVEGPGIQLVERIDGEHSVILGLPLLPLFEFLRGADMMPS